MTPFLLSLLCDPETGEALTLKDAQYDERGQIRSGLLVSATGQYEIRDGIPRFVDSALKKTVTSFGDQWNFFNFTEFKSHWLDHTVRNTFGSTDVFAGKVIVDAGGGSGAQTLWMLEAGAKHVILLDLSHSVDDVVQRNLEPSGFRNYDVVQCSIDRPPLRANAIDGIVLCHNVIQHTPDVGRTARALFRITAPSSEFVFNCYQRGEKGILKRLRWLLYHHVLRRFLPRLPDRVRYVYCHVMAFLRAVPLLGPALERTGFCVRGHVPRGSDGWWSYRKRCHRATVLNTYDLYGSHSFQHHLTNTELKALVKSLQPDLSHVLNFDRYFTDPTPVGCALRVIKTGPDVEGGSLR